MSLNITLATKPRPASRPRYHNGRMLTSSSYRAYKKELALLLGCHSRKIQRVLDGSKSLRVNYTFIFKKPKTGPNSKLPDGVEHTQKPDTDNLIKAVQDANKIAKNKQVARIGNMVVPNCAQALVRANLPELCPRYGQLDLFENYG